VEGKMFRPIDIDILVQKSDSNHQELAELTKNLIVELKGGGFSLSQDSEDKSGISFLHTFIVNLINTSTIESFVKIISTWLARDRSRTLKIQVGTNQIEASGLSKDEQKRLIEWFQIQAGMHFEK
jgi:hypothetical protein